MAKNKELILGVDYLIGVFYCSCIYEAGFELISLHRTLEGACKGMSELKNRHHLQNIESINFSLADISLMEFLKKTKEEQIKELEKRGDSSLFDSVEDYIHVMTYNQGRISFFDHNDIAYRYEIVLIKD